MAELPDDWKIGDDGSPAPNWVRHCIAPAATTDRARHRRLGSYRGVPYARRLREVPWTRDGRASAHDPGGKLRVPRDVLARSDQQAAGEQMLTRLLKADIEIRTPKGLTEAAWGVADELGWAKTYDAQYVALARMLDCKLVSIDERLLRRDRPTWDRS